MVWGIVAAVVVTAVISIVQGASKKPNRSKAQPPRVPDSTYGHKLPIIFNLGIVGGNLIYTTPPFKVVDVIGGKGGRPKEEREDYEVEVMAFLLSFVPENEVTLERLFLNGEEVYNPSSSDPDLQEKTADFLANHIVFYGGSSSQTIDPDLLALEGIGNSVAFVHSSALFLKGIRLSRFGNSYPTIQAVLKSTEEFTLGSYMRKVIELAEVNLLSQEVFGVDALTVDTQFDTVNFDGAVFMPDGNDWERFLRPLLEFYQLVIQESTPGQYVITYPLNQINTDTADILTIDEQQALGIDGEDSFTVTDFTQEEVPNKLTLKFLDEYKDFDENVVTVYNTQGKSNNEQEISMPYLFNRQIAVNGAQRLLRALWTRKEQLSIKLPIIDLSLVQLGGLINITNNNILTGKNYIVTEFTVSPKGFFEIQAERLNFNLYNYDANAEVVEGETGFSSGNAQAQALMQSQIADVNLIEQSDSPRQGVYVLYDLAGLQNTAYLFRSDDDITYNFVQSYTTTSPFAHVSVASIFNTSPYVVDYSSTIQIVLNDSNLSLTTISDDDFFAGDQVLLWGKELIAFKGATLLGGSTYNLTGLIRGFKGTESFINEVKDTRATIVRLNGSSTLPRYELEPTDVGTIYFKLTANSSPLLSTIPTDIVNFTNNSALPFAPYKLEPRYLASGNVQFEWIQRSSNDNNQLITDNGSAEGDLDGKTFFIEITQFGSPTVVRTDTITNLTTYTYTNANRTADGLSGLRVDFTVYQISPITGVNLGYPSIP